MNRKTIYLLPIGEISNMVIDAVSYGVERSFHFSVSVLPAIKIPHNAYNAKRDQYKSTIILKDIETMLPDDAIRMLGITDSDIYADNLNYVFGEAVIDGWVGVISLYRLYPEIYGQPHDEDLYLERAVKEAVHELGHTFGLRHCTNPRCIMHFSNNIHDTDYKSVEFCGETAEQLNVKLESLRSLGE